MADSSILFPGQMSCSLTIDDVAFAYGPGGFKNMCITENIFSYLPACRINFQDFNTGSATTEKTSITEGASIKVVMGDGNLSPEGPTDFYVFSLPKNLNATVANNFSVYGVLDCAKYLRGVADKSFDDTSNGAIDSIIEDDDMKLDSDCDDFDDKMVWLPSRANWGSHIHNIAMHGWSSDTSVTVVGVKLNYDTGAKNNGTLMYKDITKLFQADSGKKFTTVETEVSENNFRIEQWSTSSQSSALNNLAGYSSRATGQTMSDDNKHEYKDVQATLASENLEMGRNQRQEVVGQDGKGVARSEYMAPDCGLNVHKNYHKAWHQNRRLRMLYSTSIILMVKKFTGIELLDTVQVNLSNPQLNTGNPEYTGKYVVTAKSRMVSGMHYYEKFRLTSMGRNADVGNSSFNGGGV